jgi:hypothetical protein
MAETIASKLALSGRLPAGNAALGPSMRFTRKTSASKQPYVMSVPMAYRSP